MVVNEIEKFCTGAGGSPNTVVNVSEKELGAGANVQFKQGLFNVTYKKAGIGGIHESVHGYMDEERFCQVEKIVSRGKLIVSLFKK